MKKIVVENLVKIFGDRPGKALELLKKGKTKDEILARTGRPVGVADVSFHVEEGEILVIMGLSGSGKSTLVRCVNRLIEPTAGSVVIDGVDVTALPKDKLLEFRRTKFGMVFQNFALFPHKTVADNAAFGLEIQGKDPGKRREKALRALEQVGLAGWEDKYPGELSGGMQQRVGLARALALDPDILLMDEAFSALDPLIRRDMQDELVTLQETMRKTIVFITHDLDEAIKLGDRIVLMKDGAVVQEGTAEDILTNPATRYVERFVEDVDLSKALTAASVMKKPGVTVHLPTDGPRTALRKMDERGISSIFALNKDHKLVGVITADDAAAALERGEKKLEGAVRTDFIAIGPDTPVQELMADMALTFCPAAVVNEDGRLKGVIVRGSLLAGLAEKGRAQNG